MSVAISWANKMQLAKCDIMVGFPISSHICSFTSSQLCSYIAIRSLYVHMCIDNYYFVM